MNNPEPLDRLADFYRSLDSVPTPSLALNPTTKWGFLGVLFAPLAASLIAYGFVACCAYLPAKPGQVPRLPTPMDRLAAKEMKEESPRVVPHQHASAEKLGGAV
jgi:hypothetical protein